MMKKNAATILLLILITLASLALKIAYINTTEIISPIRADAAEYVLYGYNLYKHGIYSQEQSETPEPDSFRSPGFPLLITLAFHLGGNDDFYLLTLLMQITITSLLVPLSYLLARMILPNIGAFFVSLLVALSAMAKIRNTVQATFLHYWCLVNPFGLYFTKKTSITNILSSK